MPLSKEELSQRKEQYQTRFVSRDFLTIKPPSKTEGYEYILRCLGEVRQFTPKTGPNAGTSSDVVDVVYLSENTGDPSLETGKEYTLNLNNAVLHGEIKKFGTLTGRTLSVTNLGKRQGKKYYDYDIHEIKGTL